MEADKPRRPLYRRKRAWAAAAVWLVVGYELGVGPAAYCVRRGWLSPQVVFDRLYAYPLLPDSWGEASGLWAYNRWWADLGERHARAAED